MIVRSAILVAIVAGAAMVALSHGPASAQPYGDDTASPVSSLSVDGAPIAAGQIPAVLAARTIAGVLAAPASDVSVAIVLIGPDGAPGEGATPLELQSTVNTTTGAFETSVPAGLEPARYAVYVGDVLVGQFDLVAAAGAEPQSPGSLAEPDSASSSDGPFDVNTVVLLAIVIAVVIGLGGAINAAYRRWR